MKLRPPHEPTRDFHPSHRLHDDAARNPRSLGCRGCPDFDQCGGLHTDAGIFDCGDLCSCADRSKCDMVCRRKPHAFFERLQEVEGFDLATIPRVAPVARPPFPDLVPLIDTNTAGPRRSEKLSLPSRSTRSSIWAPASRWCELGPSSPHAS